MTWFVCWFLFSFLYFFFLLLLSSCRCLLDNSGTDFVGVFRALGLAAQIAGQIFGLLDDAEACGLDFVGVCIQFQVSQHHDGRQQQCGGIGQIFASNIGRGAMHRFEECTIQAHIAWWRQAQAAHQTGAHVRQNVTVQVGHHLKLQTIKQEKNTWILYYYHRTHSNRQAGMTGWWQVNKQSDSEWEMRLMCGCVVIATRYLFILILFAIRLLGGRLKYRKSFVVS